MEHFQVVCTNSEWSLVNTWERLWATILGINAPDPVKNGIYTVVEIIDNIYYGLEEFPDSAYRKECFIPLKEVESQAYKQEEVEFLN